jgi:hypothetical protein
MSAMLDRSLALLTATQMAQSQWPTVAAGISPCPRDLDRRDRRGSEMHTAP